MKKLTKITTSAVLFTTIIFTSFNVFTNNVSAKSNSTFGSVLTEAVRGGYTENGSVQIQAPKPVEQQTTVVAPAPKEEAPKVESHKEEAPKQEVSAPAVNYTNIVFKDGYNTFKYNSLDEAKASINIPRLTNEEANQRAISNKSTYANEASEVLRLINEYRRANGLGEVTYDDTIATAAMHRAAESAYANWNMTAYENGTTKRHIRPTFEKASSIMNVYGLSGNFGENFGRFQENANEIMDGWKNSSSHNALMLNGIYTKCGIGVAKDAEGYYYWVAIFM